MRSAIHGLLSTYCAQGAGRCGHSGDGEGCRDESAYNFIKDIKQGPKMEWNGVLSIQSAKEILERFQEELRKVCSYR